MPKEYTEEETRIWRTTQPQKMIIVKVIITSGRGNILLVKSSYKKTWQFPGGGVDNGESPKEAAVREVKEELDLDVALNDLVLKDIIYKQDEEMLFIVYEKQTPISEDVKMTTQKDEILDYTFYDIKSVAPLLSPYYLLFWEENYL